MKTRPMAMGAASAVMALLIAGCPLFKESAGEGTSKQFGRLEHPVPSATVEQVHAAAKRGLADLKLIPTMDRLDGLTGKLQAVFADGKKVTIDTKKNAEGITTIYLRAGTIDTDRAQQVLEAIKKHL